MWQTMAAGEFSALLIGIALGAALMGGGVFLATLLLRRSTSPVEIAPEQLLQLLRNLAQWTRSMSTEVAQFDATVERVLPTTSENTTTQPGAEPSVSPNGTESTVLWQANRHLQQKLAEAREELERQSRLIHQLMERALSDPLTGLPNRRAVDEQLVRCMATWKRQHRPFAVVLADIDNFKQHNDQYGHAVGDVVLTSVATALRESVRAGDFVARFGGEEFVVILPETTLSEACVVAERMRTAVGSRSVDGENHSLLCSLSCGVACIQPGENTKRLLRRADEAMYAAKSHGKNRTFYHDGHTVRPVLVEQTLATEAHPDEPLSSISDEEWQQICSDLRVTFRHVLSTGQPAHVTGSTTEPVVN